MVYPMMVSVDFSSLKRIHERPKGLIITLVVNWLIKPFTMAALGWLFFNVLFAGWVDPQSATEYIAGMILLGVAPCTAMVFVWSQLTKGDPNYTLVQVSVNDVIMVFAFAPLAAFLLGVSDIEVPWETLLLSVVLYVLLPLVAGALTRRVLEAGGGGQRVDDFVRTLKPWSIIGLLATVVLLFGFQAERILGQPQTILLIAIPLALQTYFIFFLSWKGGRWLRLDYRTCEPASMIGPVRSGLSAAIIMTCQPAWQLPITTGLPSASGWSAATLAMKAASAAQTSSTVWPGTGSGRKPTK